MRRLSLALGDRSYPILIGCGLLDQTELILPFLRTPNVALISNTTVAPLYLDLMLNGLKHHGVAVTARSRANGISTPSSLDHRTRGYRIC